ncbi:hypothetical protein HWV62_6401 [Athelia sp. TMB]|nr:hypothetical protein HWV62_6401 [Athelia sp. TMB]
MVVQFLATKRLPAQVRVPFLSATRCIHLTTAALAERPSRFETQASEVVPEAEDLSNFELPDVIRAFQTATAPEHETTAAGHLVMRQDRHVFKYLKLIENDLPQLVALRQPFKPPTSKTPLIVRSVDYAGEQHPALNKRTVVVPISQLPLRDGDAIHKFKVLAGPRWSPEPPKDAGVGPNESDREHGYMKISCEDFPEPAQNLKWASDVIDRLISEANDPKDKFRDVPLDTRHLVSKARKAKNGAHRSGQVFHRPSLRDFPVEWLPDSAEKLSVPQMQGSVTN